MSSRTGNRCAERHSFYFTAAIGQLLKIWESVTMTACKHVFPRAIFVVGLVALPMVLFAAERRVQRSSAKTTSDTTSVEMFEAISSGDINVRFIPKNDMEANIQITNNTQRPLSV